MQKLNLLNVNIDISSEEYILEQIKKNIKGSREFLHIVSLNPENLVVAQQNEKFKTVLNQAEIQIIDGVGVSKALQFIYSQKTMRITGVALMEKLLDLAGNMSLITCLIGGKADVAEKIAKCYQERYPEAKYVGFEGIQDIANPKNEEEMRIFSIVADIRPHLIFVSFGSPKQELWIDRHKKDFNNSICMGVGGAFDFIAGRTKRAPKFIRTLGLEWLYRLMLEPWRWRRQLRLLVFIYLVLKQKFNNKLSM